MKDGIGIFLWKISVALYLIANGVLGLMRYADGDFWIIFNKLGFDGDALNLFVRIAGVIAFIAGVAIALEMLNVKISFLETLTFIVAIIWAVYIIVEIFSWTKGGNNNIWHLAQKLAVHLMVLANLLITSKKA
jgi:hypothetical protein